MLVTRKRNIYKRKKQPKTPIQQQQKYVDNTSSSYITNDKDLKIVDIPKVFINPPRHGGVAHVCENDIHKAIRSLVGTSRMSYDMLVYLRIVANELIDMMINTTPKSKRPQEWLKQSLKRRSFAIKNLTEKALDFTPSIPLGMCINNWIAEYILVEIWNEKASTLKRQQE